MDAADELRQAAAILRNPYRCGSVELMQAEADLLDAIADQWPTGPVHTSTEPAARVRRAALATARAINGTTRQPMTDPARTPHGTRQDRSSA